MSTILKNILSFTGLSIGVPSVLPHLLNANGVAVAPSLGGADAAGFTITADATNVTVTRTATGASAVHVYVEYWHTFERALPLPGGLSGLTPLFLSAGIGDGGESVFQNFVFRPGGTAGGNVYTDWASLITAQALVQGYKTIQFDSSLAACTIPAGVWDVTQCEFIGFFPGATGTGPTVSIADGASFTNLRKISGELTVINLNATTAPVTIAAAAGAAAIFELGVGPHGDYPTITNTGAAPFFDASALLAGQTFLIRAQGVISGANRAIEMGNSAGNIQLSIFDATRIAAGMIAGVNVAAVLQVFNFGPSGQLNRQAAFAGSITFGAMGSFTGITPMARHWMFPASINQATTVPSTAALVLATGLGMNTCMRFNTTAADIAQTLPLIRLAAPANGAISTTAGSLESTGMTVIIKNEIGANNVNVSPNGTNPDTIDGGAGPVVIPPGGSRTFMSDGINNWSIVGGYL